jgi:hypothetical protein
MSPAERAVLFGVMISLAALPGCYENTDVTLHEPGEYKGQKDDLIAQQAREGQQQRLRDRFMAVQTDR